MKRDTTLSTDRTVNDVDVDDQNGQVVIANSMLSTQGPKTDAAAFDADGIPTNTSTIAKPIDHPLDIKSREPSIATIVLICVLFAGAVTYIGTC